jgi:hypothetical protein
MAPEAENAKGGFVPWAQVHWDSAVALFRQRRALTVCAEVDADVVARNEHLLRMHLHVLARCEFSEPAVEKAPLEFVMLARRLSSPLEAVRCEGYALAREMMIKGGEAEEGAFAALTLFPETDDAGMLALYRSHPELRPQLFNLWREQGRAVPTGLLNRAELQGGDETLQAAALAYAATRPEIGVDLFRPYYAHLQSGVAPRCSGRLVALSLWGALVRGEPGAAEVLRRAVECEDDAEIRFKLLRIAALSADAQMLPVLQRLLEERPTQGARLLALHGSAEAVDILLEALSQAATMEAVARAWSWVGGKTLPQKPRLHAVGQEGGQGVMPDAECAHAWWSQQRSVLPPEGRMLYGAPLSLPRLYALAQSRAGEAGRDLLDLLAFKLGRPLGISPHAEQARRRSLIQTISTSSPPQGGITHVPTR